MKTTVPIQNRVSSSTIRSEAETDSVPASIRDATEIDSLLGGFSASADGAGHQRRDVLPARPASAIGTANPAENPAEIRAGAPTSRGMLATLLPEHTEREVQLLKPASIRKLFRDLDLFDDAEFRQRAAALFSILKYVELNFSRLSEKRQRIMLEEMARPGISGLTEMDIDLSGSILPLSDITESLRRVSRNNKRLKIRLTVADHRINLAYASELADALLKTRITRLSLSDNLLGNAGASMLFNALVKSQVTHLAIYGNAIDHMAAGAIAGNLGHSTLQNLNLNRNRMGDPGITAIAGILHQSRLTSLSLTFNRISHEGAAVFSDALPNSSLVELDLRGNNIGDHGAASIAQALPRCRISRLGLRENSIGDTGAAAVLLALPSSAVRALDIRGNNIGATGIAALDKARMLATAVRISR